VRHYAGGLVEWFDPANQPPVPAPPPARRTPVTNEQPTAGDAIVVKRAPRIALAGNFSARFIDWFADRTVSGLFWLWVEIVALCGVVYWLLASIGAGALIAHERSLSVDLRGLISAVYFSAVTATSVGYGDIVPVGIARVVAIGEGIAGLILFGCVVSKFVSRRQEQLIGEIHHIAFEDRLGRVRTNLHLVRTELQVTARLCEGQDIPPPEAVSRVESLAMVFVGELHAVHDLLYRPQQTPDESELEAILAGLASTFREFNELLLCVQAQQAARTDLLRVNVATMGRLAREICGECVPRQFAPALRTWMDQIQRLSGDIAQI